MKDIPKSSQNLSPEKRALLAKRLRSTESVTDLLTTEPIAITGIACRFPGGANDPETFWQHLKEGRNDISEVPAGRWDRDAFYSSHQREPGKIVSRKGGFLEQVGLFDADFFGIAPKEAARMDPQQALFLEVAWEALENAGLAVEHLAGGKVGVFTGIYSSDHASLEFANVHQIDGYTTLSSIHCMVPNRLSYLLDLQGPSLAIDTACSSSLVAMHLACQSLRNMECDLAVVGGINLLLSPGMGIAFSNWGMLSADGYCKTFDASANGYVRSEGCGVVILKRLSDALSEQDPVQALVLGSAVNQDGRTTRLTAPNMHAQRKVIQQALDQAHVSPEQITYVETHGTGTALGDPIEVEALTEVLGHPRKTPVPCVLGAVKTNIGHLETAAGMAGLIKIVLAMRHEEIPANLHFQKLNPYISLEQTPFVIPTSTYPWPVNDAERRYAGLSAFGAGGTNAHMVLCEPAHFSTFTSATENECAYLLPISARSNQSLQALAQEYHRMLTIPQETPDGHNKLYDLCYSASLRRSHHSHRLAVVGHNKQEMAAHLAKYLQNEAHPGLVTSTKSTKRKNGAVFIFPGQGSQWIGMGKQLLAQEPVFREMLMRCEQALQPYVDWSLQSVLTDDNQADRWEDIACIQPLLFALQVSLAALWQSWGNKPIAVVGHSMGEIAAAYVAGILALEDAARIICCRSQLLRRVQGQGAMLMVGLSLEQSHRALASSPQSVSVAVSNSPRSTVLSGDPEVLRTLAASLSSQNIFCNWVHVDVASHSPYMDPLRSDLLASLESLRPQTGTIPFYSTVTGRVCEGYELTAEYWVRNLREPVLFSTVIQQLVREDQEVFLEISPHPILLPAIEQCIQQNTQEYVLLPSLRRAEPERATLLESLGTLYTRGLFHDWRKIYPSIGHWIPLPSYPWHHQHFEHLKQETSAHQQIPAVAQPSGLVQDKEGMPEHAQEEVTTWFYQQEWIVSPHKDQSAQKRSGNWLLFLDRTDVGQQLLSVLAEHAVHTTLVFPGNTYAMIEPGRYMINPSSREDMHHLFQALTQPTSIPYTEIVYLWSLDIAPLEQTTFESLQRSQDLSSISILHLVQTLEQVERLVPLRLWLVTRETQRGASNRIEVLQAPLWGLGRVIAQEHPELHCSCIDIEITPDRKECAAIYTEIVQNSAEDQIVLRSDQRFVARLQKVHLARTEQEKSSLFQNNATYLITGGFGGIGLRLAYWLAEKGARHLVLLGRHAASEAATEQIDELEKKGIEVSAIHVDVTQTEQIRQALTEIQHTLPPLRGIFHAAGLLDDGILLQQNRQRFESVMAPKVTGTWNLHILTRDIPLDFFVLFSSASSLLGSPGQSNYAAGNAFMDALAHSRVAQNQPALSINWGPWGEVGLATRADREEYLSARGFESISSQDAFKALEILLGQTFPQIGVFPIQWDKFLTLFPVSSKSPLLSTMLSRLPAEQENRKDAGLLFLLEQAPHEKRLTLLVQHVKSLVASVLGLSQEHTIDPHRGFFEMGMNSLMTIDLKNRLQAQMGSTFNALPTTIIFDYPTIEALSAYLIEKIFVQETHTKESRKNASQEKDQKVAELLNVVQDLSSDALLRILNDQA